MLKQNYKHLYKYIVALLIINLSVFVIEAARITYSDSISQESAPETIVQNTAVITVQADTVNIEESSSPNIQTNFVESFRFGPVEEFFMDWDTSTVDPYQYDVKEITYDFPICLFISPEDGYSLPLKSLYKTSSFGPRWGRHHKGIDFDLNIGDSVLNMFDGMVRISTYSKSFGHFVVVRHFNGLETLYAHLSERIVMQGDIMKAGDCLGLGGNTGRSTGPHLHFEVRFRGIAFDPENLLSITCQDITSDELTIEPALFSYLTYYKRSRSSATASGGKYYTIKSGDTLGSIAKKHGTTINHLCRLNGISQNSIIRAGKQLRVR